MAPQANTDRNAKVYQAVVVDGRKQADVAEEFKLTTGRIRQIVQREKYRLTQCS